MFGLSTGHLIILLVVVLLLFGTKRLPELGSSLGKGIRGFKKALEGMDEEDKPKLNHHAQNQDPSKTKTGTHSSDSDPQG